MPSKSKPATTAAKPTTKPKPEPKPATTAAKPKPEPKPAKPVKPAFDPIHGSYAGASTGDTKRAAAIFSTGGRVFSNFRHRSDTYIRDVFASLPSGTVEFAGGNRDKAIIELCIYGGLLTQSGDKLTFTPTGIKFCKAKPLCAAPGSYVTHDGFFTHVKAL